MGDSTFLDGVEKRGFAIVPRLFHSNELEAIKGELAASTLHRSRAGVRHAMKTDAVASLAQDSRLLTLARSILGEQAFPFRATMFQKSADANWLVVWHQDTALPLRHRRNVSGWGPWSVKDGVVYAHAPASALSRILALRVHLDDSAPDNGPLRVLPGTHVRGVLSDDVIHELARKEAVVECTVAQGSVVAMRPLLVHASSKCHSDRKRRVLHIEYAAGSLVDDGLELAIT